ncbi:hypothetical protein D3C80_1741810 [compost metagenome]
MEQVVPWKELLALNESHYSEAGEGCKPYPLETRLRVIGCINGFRCATLQCR